jgi:serine/threonine-protein kinase
MSSRYESLLLIGIGGMASVHVGRLLGAEGFSRLVALKRAHAHVREDRALADSMRDEARLAARLHHTNIVSTIDVEEEDGELVLVLDYVEGTTLSALLAKAAESPGNYTRAMVRIILDVAAGLHAAHNAVDEAGRSLQLVHRDVSPSNVLVGTDGVARVSDFGIAKAQLAGRERTETGLLKGKASYMAPEYVLHQKANAPSDLFSLGIVAWEALTGARLFKAPSEIETLNRVITAQVHPMAEHDRMLASLDVVVLRALERLPEDRQASVDEFAAELATVARAHDLLGSHTEVSELVERLAAKELEERRRELARQGLSFVASPDQMRPELITSTLSGDSEAPTQALSVDRLPAMAPPGMGERVSTGRIFADIVQHGPHSTGPFQVVDTRQTGGVISSGPFRVVDTPRRSRLSSAALSSGAFKVAERGRARETLGLIGAIVLLAAALAFLGFKMRRGEGVIDAPPTPSARVEPVAASAASAPITPVASTSAEPTADPSDELDAGVQDASARKGRNPHRRPGPAPAAQPTLVPKKAPPNPYGN